MAAGILRRLFGRGAGEGQGFSFPAALENPRLLIAVVGPDPGDIWAGLFLLNNLTRHYQSAEIAALVPDGELELLNLLARMPAATGYQAPARKGGLPRVAREDGAVAFCVSGGDDSERLLEASGASIRVSALRNGAANIQLRLSPRPLPEAVHGMCETLGIAADRSWRPVPLAADSTRTSALLAPVSGRSLPYIAADGGILGAMRRSGAELPLRVVTVSGKESTFGAESRAVRAAVTAGASAVLADTRGLWSEACALGVPVVGLDRGGTFPDWGREPARSATDLPAMWADLIRKGW